MRKKTAIVDLWFTHAHICASACTYLHICTHRNVYMHGGGRRKGRFETQPVCHFRSLALSHSHVLAPALVSLQQRQMPGEASTMPFLTVPPPLSINIPRGRINEVSELIHFSHSRLVSSQHGTPLLGRRPAPPLPVTSLTCPSSLWPIPGSSPT